MKKVATCLIATVLSVSLVGCSDMNKQDVGMVTGGVLGGVLGSQIGGGNGQLVAIAGGTLLGAYLGSSVGKSMDDVDRMKMSQTLERSPTNRTTTWHNPDSGATYRVTPKRTYISRGQPCREYTTTAIIGGKSEQVYGTACRQAGGSWRVVK